MARQSTAPVQFNRSQRPDSSVTLTSGRAGKVIPVAYIPLLMGDSCSGRIGIDVDLAEMPRPLLNAVTANFQAWFVPKTAHPQFSGKDEFLHATSGETIKALGAADRVPPPFFTVVSGAAKTTIEGSEFFKTLGLHVPVASDINSDLLDAFSVIYNFRLAAHSSRLARRDYVAESAANASGLPRAFWPSGRFAKVVPDYERSLIVGSLDLDVIAGTVALSGLAPVNGITQVGNTVAAGTDAFMAATPTALNLASTGIGINFARNSGNPSSTDLNISATLNGLFGSLAGQTIGVSLADIDKARTTQAFAKLRTAYAGNDTTGFDNDDTLIALLMQGLPVPPDMFNRPWLLSSQRVTVGFAERFATDAANLDASVTQGRASCTLSLNVPMQDTGGVILVTVEVLPERLDERMADEWLLLTQYEQLPNALRDVQRTEPVDLVRNRRVDAKHNAPGGVYGYEPMNGVWERSFTRLGGSFYQATPGAPFSEQRSAIWLPEIVNPALGGSHYLAPANFPHDVFSDTAADAFEIVARHKVTIIGLTQIGDVLAENNDDYTAIQGA